MNSIGQSVLYVATRSLSTLKLAINAGLAVTAQIMAELIVFGRETTASTDQHSVFLHALERVSDGFAVRFATRLRSRGHDYSATSRPTSWLRTLSWRSTSHAGPNLHCPRSLSWSTHHQSRVDGAATAKSISRLCFQAFNWRWVSPPDIEPSLPR